MSITRLEYKYLISEDKVDGFRKAIDPYFEYDKFALMNKDRFYTVRSIYFDTPDLHSYFEKIDGLKVRRKLRLRGYNEFTENSKVFLEIKRKYENRVLKNRSMVELKNLRGLFEGEDFGTHFNSESDEARYDAASRFFYWYNLKNMQPVILISYERTAYYLKFNNSLRLTVDSDLRSLMLPTIGQLYSEEGMKRSLNGKAIIEIKFINGYPRWLQEVLYTFGLKRLAVSKYTITLDTHNLFLHSHKRQNIILNNLFAAQHA